MVMVECKFKHKLKSDSAKPNMNFLKVFCHNEPLLDQTNKQKVNNLQRLSLTSFSKTPN